MIVMSRFLPFRFRPRLSLRALFLVILLAGVYFACGRVTAVKGARDVSSHIAESGDRPNFPAQFVAPFLYRHDSIIEATKKPPQQTTRRTYYLWLFGRVGELPITWDRTRTVAIAEVEKTEFEFEEVYFPVNSSTSAHRTAIPVQEWRMQYGDTFTGPAN